MDEKYLRFFLLVIILSLVSSLGYSEREEFKLKNGQNIRCEVLFVDIDSITVNQFLGVVGTQKKQAVYKWDEIKAEFANILKRKYGVPDEKRTEEGMFIRMGRRVTLNDSIHSVFEGYVMENECTNSTVVIYTTKKKRLQLSRSSIEKSEEIKIDLRLCLTPSQLYAFIKKNNYPISPKDHFKLAAICERIGAIKEAIKHYEKASKGDVRYLMFLGPKVPELKKTHREQFAMDLLSSAKRSIKRKKYREAAQKLAQILDYYGDTTAAGEAKMLQTKNQEHLDRQVAKQVIGDYYNLIKWKLKKRVSEKVLDGPSRPGLKIILTNNKIIEGEYCDENGNPIPPPSPDEGEKEENEDFEEEYSQDGFFIYVKTVRTGDIIEIPKELIKKMEPVELNKKLKQPKFNEDHRPYLTGRDSPLHRDIRRELSYKYGINERDIKEMWDKRNVQRRDINGKIILKSCAKKMTVNYGRGTFFSPKLRRSKRLNPKYPIKAADPDKFFDSLSSSDKFNTLLGIFAEYSMEIIEGSVKTRECSVCKGSGKGKKEEITTPADNRPNRNGGRRQPTATRQYGCPNCHGIGYTLSFKFF